MESKRILYSDAHSHDIRMSELTMGIIQHGLHVLATAFSLEPQYRQLIGDAIKQMNDAFKSPGIEDKEPVKCNSKKL